MRLSKLKPLRSRKRDGAKTIGGPLGIKPSLNCGSNGEKKAKLEIPFWGLYPCKLPAIGQQPEGKFITKNYPGGKKNSGNAGENGRSRGEDVVELEGSSEPSF